jgi:CheY-like chemotaxis protein
MAKNKQQGFTVLVVDNSTADRKHLRKLLEKAEYEVLQASFADEAVKKAMNHQPNIIFMEIIMENGASGYKACKVISENEVTERIPICMVSSIDDDDGIMMGLAVGACTHYTKPYKDADILKIVAEEKALYEHRHN